MLIFASPEAKARFRPARKKASCGGGTETLVFLYHTENQSVENIAKRQLFYLPNRKRLSYNHFQAFCFSPFSASCFKSLNGTLHEGSLAKKFPEIEM